MSPPRPAGGPAASPEASIMGEAAATAVNAGLAAGRVGARQAAAALAAALAHTPGLTDRARALARELAAATAGRTVATPAKGDTRFTDPALRTEDDIGCPLAQQPAAAGDKILRQALDEAEIVHRHGIFRKVDAAREDRRQGGLHLADLIAG